MNLVSLSIPYLYILHVVIISIRVGAALLFAPIWGHPGLPQYLRIVLVFSIAVGVAAMTPFTPDAVTNPGPALNFQLYGTTNDSSGAETTRTMDISGNGQFSGAIYAPNHEVTLNGSGSTGVYVGAVVAKKVKLKGDIQFHYDEAVGRGGLIANYKIASWFEDER